MEYLLRAATDNDRRAVVSIFNYYVENTFAAYAEERLPYDFFDALRERSKGYPFLVAETDLKEVVGFGLLRPFRKTDSFRQTAAVTYFILPAHTGKGIGSRLLEALTAEGKKMKLKVLLADITARNDISIRFHTKNGFKPCGRFERIGKKFDEEFDVVWMQKFI